MKRYKEFDIRGKHFVLALTINAQIKLDERFDKFDLNEVLFGENLKNVYENTAEVFSMLSGEGANYCKMFEEKNADTLSKDEFYHFFSLGDINPVRNAIVEACVAGWSRDVELEEDEPKN